MSRFVPQPAPAIQTSTSTTTSTLLGSSSSAPSSASSKRSAAAATAAAAVNPAHPLAPSKEDGDESDFGGDETGLEEKVSGRELSHEVEGGSGTVDAGASPWSSSRGGAVGGQRVSGARTPANPAVGDGGFDVGGPGARKSVRRAELSLTTNIGTVAWAAPEMLMGGESGRGEYTAKVGMPGVLMPSRLVLRLPKWQLEGLGRQPASFIRKSQIAHSFGGS